MDKYDCAGWEIPPYEIELKHMKNMNDTDFLLADFLMNGEASFLLKKAEELRKTRALPRQRAFQVPRDENKEESLRLNNEEFKENQSRHRPTRSPDLARRIQGKSLRLNNDEFKENQSRHSPTRRSDPALRKQGRGRDKRDIEDSRLRNQSNSKERRRGLKTVKLGPARFLG
ncbi:MAG: hypothetical protein LBO66_13485 [Deltaproteobacteria bacterium]|nr:hypothetical protein [Deltaproteobacteria bacterium]